MANLAHELLADTQCSEPEIILEQNSMNTAGNAKECSVLLGHDRDRQVIVVTHKSHMPRAMRLFQREFGELVEPHVVRHGKLWEALWCWLYECLALVKATTCRCGFVNYIMGNDLESLTNPLPL